MRQNENRLKERLAIWKLIKEQKYCIQDKYFERHVTANGLFQVGEPLERKNSTVDFNVD
jgi:hypothetical protein